MTAYFYCKKYKENIKEEERESYYVRARKKTSHTRHIHIKNPLKIGKYYIY